jgi:hypothetical protein
MKNVRKPKPKVPRALRNSVEINRWRALCGSGAASPLKNSTHRPKGSRTFSAIGWRCRNITIMTQETAIRTKPACKAIKERPRIIAAPHFEYGTHALAWR